MFLYLISVYTLAFEQRMAFVVRAYSRSQAKTIIAHYCKEQGYDISPTIRSHELNIEEGEFVRIDGLIH
jgi:hypothetical protein